MREKWIIVIIGGMLGLSLLFYGINKRSSIMPGDWTQIMILLGLVVVTGAYAWAASRQADASVKMAEEMREQRYDAVRPIIDIEGAFESVEEAQMKMGSVPDKLTCRLRNIGVGPATDVVSFVQAGTQPDSKYLRTFGALAKGALVKEGEIYEKDKWPLSLKQRDNRKFLVAYYRDVYGRCFESSREVTVDKEKGRWELGPLKTPEIAEEEFPK